MSKEKEALKLALEALEDCYSTGDYNEYQFYDEDLVNAAKKALREALTEQPAQPIRWDSSAVNMAEAMANLPKTGSKSVVEYAFIGDTKICETKTNIEDGVVTSITHTNTAPTYINSTGADASISISPMQPKGTGQIAFHERTTMTEQQLAASEALAEQQSGIKQVIELYDSPEQPAQQQEPFGYFKPEPFGWTDCAETDEGAVALYERPPASKPLTDKQISKLWSDAHNDTTDRMAFQVFARLVEAAHNIGGEA